MGSCEEPYWGQCFEEFYGPDYCKNLRKDMEKLKDENYDGDPLRFQREWVIPTVNLLRRLRHMGFPIRTQLHVIIHLYNPVDSMFAGEMHFQVGRKAPGTLTLKFTKQNSAGLFVIQPKTLNVTDEVNLNNHPNEFIKKVRLEMKDSCIDTASLLQTLVLMTDTCKLERQSFNTLFSKLHVVENASYQPLTSIPQDMPPSLSRQSSILMSANNNWGMCLQTPFMLDTLGPVVGALDKPTPPWNLCVKNYVSYNGLDKTSSEVAVHEISKRADGGQSDLKSGHHFNAGQVYRQPRSTIWHTEPEENDEIMDVHGNKVCKVSSQRADLDDVEGKLADVRLWDPPPKTHSANHKKKSSENLDEAVGAYMLTTSKGNQHFDENLEMDPRMQQRSLSAISIEKPKNNQEVFRRYSEPRTKETDAYFKEHQQSSTIWRNNLDSHAAAMKDVIVNDDFHRHLLVNSSGLHVKENLTSNENVTNATTKSSHSTPIEQRFCGSSTRTESLDEYMGISTGNQISGYPHFSESDNSSLGRRTLSLDAYVSSNDSNEFDNSFIRQSDDNIANSNRTCLVDDYHNNGEQQSNLVSNKSSESQESHCYGTNSTSISTSLNVPNISILRGFPTSNATVDYLNGEYSSGSVSSWASHVQAVNSTFDCNYSRPTLQFHSQMQSNERNGPLMSHESFASWESHVNSEIAPKNLLPATVEEINDNIQF